MKGRINHVMLNVNRYEEAKRFYDSLLPKVGSTRDGLCRRRSQAGERMVQRHPFGCRGRSHVFARTSSIGVAWGSVKSPSPPTVASRWMSSRRKSSGTAAG